MTAPAVRAWIIWPREHGAWGMLLQPLVAASILARHPSWLLVPAALAALLLFLIREPVITLARQRFVWRAARPESAAARRCLLWQLPLLLLCGLLLLLRLPPRPLLVLGALALTLTAIAIWLAVTNRQRSILMQIASSAGLTTIAFLPPLIAAGAIPPWAWQLWALLTAHAVASICVVHARLDARAAREPDAQRSYTVAAAAQAGQSVAALWLSMPLAAPILLSACGNAFELWRLRRPGALAEPLRGVGFRALGFSIIHTALTAAALWQP